MTKFKNTMESIMSLINSSSDDSWKYQFLNIYSIYLTGEINDDPLNYPHPELKVLRNEIESILPDYEKYYNDDSVTEKEIDEILEWYRTYGLIDDIDLVKNGLVIRLIDCVITILDDGVTPEITQKIKSVYKTYLLFDKE